MRTDLWTCVTLAALLLFMYAVALDCPVEWRPVFLIVGLGLGFALGFALGGVECQADGGEEPEVEVGVG